jgi:3'(2'), 5'-bisphosphate nucleotidase
VIDIQKENWLGELLPCVVALAREAGHAIMTVYADASPAVEYKADKSPLTQADLASHRVVLEGLVRLTPDWPLISEESPEIPFDQRRCWRHFWMVDPLDGTKEFLGRTGEFTVNIALMEGNAPILGVVYAPVVDKLYFAAKGVGAFKVEQSTVSPIKTVRAAKTTVRMVVSRSHQRRDEDFQPFACGAETCEFIPMGSALKFCLVAEGAADVYPRTGPTMEWDTAAAQCILEEAGGFVTDLDGNSMSYNKPVLLNSGFLAKGAS